jgi:hypothetical protein
LGINPRQSANSPSSVDWCRPIPYAVRSERIQALSFRLSTFG